MRASLVAQMVKRLPTMRETRVQSLGQEDLLEKEMATHSSTLAWRIPWTEEPGSYSPWGHKESDTTEPSMGLNITHKCYFYQSLIPCHGQVSHSFLR